MQNTTPATLPRLNEALALPMEAPRPVSIGRLARLAPAAGSHAAPTSRGATVEPAMSPALSADHPQRCQVCAARMTCLIGQLPRPHLERLDPLIRELAFRKGEHLLNEGADPGVVRTIKLGTVVLNRAGQDGTARPVALVGRGHLLGLWGLLGQATQVGGQALTSGRLCELPANALRGVFDKDPSLLAMVHQHVVQSLARLADWSQLMRQRGLPRQLVSALTLLAREQGTRTVLLPSQTALAELLCTSRETVARTLRQLEDQGHLLRVDRWHGELTGTARQVFRNDTST